MYHEFDREFTMLERQQFYLINLQDPLAMTARRTFGRGDQRLLTTAERARSWNVMIKNIMNNLQHQPIDLASNSNYFCIHNCDLTFPHNIAQLNLDESFGELLSI